MELRFDYASTPTRAFKRELARYSPAGRCRCWSTATTSAVWDSSLAIAEYLAEKFPDKHAVAATRPRERARARSVCAEMHSGFAALRTHCAMNIEARLPEVGARLLAEQPDVRADLGAHRARCGTSCWRRTAARCCSATSAIADAYFAPVVHPHPRPTRCRCRRRIAGLHRRACWRCPACAAWIDDALAEQDFLAFEEPYRTAR